jgi:hypothetical protein
MDPCKYDLSFMIVIRSKNQVVLFSFLAINAEEFPVQFTVFIVQLTNTPTDTTGVAVDRDEHNVETGTMECDEKHEHIEALVNFRTDNTFGNSH